MSKLLIYLYICVSICNASALVAVTCGCGFVTDSYQHYQQYQQGNRVNIGVNAPVFLTFTAENSTGIFLDSSFYPFGCTPIAEGAFLTLVYTDRTYQYVTKTDKKCIGITVGQFAGIISGLIVLCCCCVVSICLYFMCCKKERTSKTIKRAKAADLQAQLDQLGGKTQA